MRQNLFFCVTPFCSQFILPFAMLSKRKEKKITTTMKINSICRICFTRAQSAVSSHSPEEKKKVAHTHNILKYTSSFGQNGICYWKLCHEKLFSKFRIALFPTGWLSACVLVRVCTTVAAFWMINPEPCVLKLNSINNNKMNNEQALPTFCRRRRQHFYLQNAQLNFPLNYFNDKCILFVCLFVYFVLNSY